MKAVSLLSVIVLILYLGKTDACPEVLCTIFCPYGHVLVNGCRTCECIDPCKNVHCPKPQVCVPNSYNCSSTGICLSKPKCVIICPAIKCRPCPYGYEIDKHGCQTCQCIDPCKGHKCKHDEKCKIELVSCRDDSCSGYKPICKKICPALQCKLNCKYGYEEDCNNCPICKCRDPCKDVICPRYYYCTVQTIFCLVPPCPPPFPVCESYCKENDLLFDNYGFPVTCSSQSCPKDYTCTFVPSTKKSYCCRCPSE